MTLKSGIFMISLMVSFCNSVTFLGENRNSCPWPMLIWTLIDQVNSDQIHELKNKEFLGRAGVMTLKSWLFIPGWFLILKKSFIPRQKALARPCVSQQFSGPHSSFITLHLDYLVKYLSHPRVLLMNIVGIFYLFFYLHAQHLGITK